MSLPPAIATNPASQNVVSNSSATLVVKAFGTAPFDYQWFFNGNSLADATNATLLIPNMQTASAGDYQVVITNAYGSVTSSIATLTRIRAAPTPNPAGHRRQSREWTISGLIHQLNPECLLQCPVHHQPGRADGRLGGDVRVFQYADG